MDGLNFLDMAGPVGPFGPWLSAPGSVPTGVVSAPGRPSRLLSAGAWDSAITHCKLTPNTPFLLHNSPPNSPLSPGASKPPGTLSGQITLGFSQSISGARWSGCLSLAAFSPGSRVWGWGAGWGLATCPTQKAGLLNSDPSAHMATLPEQTGLGSVGFCCESGKDLCS